jgi:uncharacterized protein (DUF302 family)
MSNHLAVTRLRVGDVVVARVAGDGRPAQDYVVTTAAGIVDRPSKQSVDETVERIEEILRSKGITLFALIDHGGEAAKVGLKMPPTKLLIFGKPLGGTPLMLARPRIAIDLPLKILVWEDAQGQVWVSANSAAYLQDRHGLPPEHFPTLAVAEALLAAATTEKP